MTRIFLWRRQSIYLLILSNPMSSEPYFRWIRSNKDLMTTQLMIMHWIPTVSVLVLIKNGVNFTLGGLPHVDFFFILKILFCKNCYYYLRDIDLKPQKKGSDFKYWWKYLILKITHFEGPENLMKRLVPWVPILDWQA